MAPAPYRRRGRRGDLSAGAAAELRMGADRLSPFCGRAPALGKKYHAQWYWSLLRDYSGSACDTSVRIGICLAGLGQLDLFTLVRLKRRKSGRMESCAESEGRSARKVGPFKPPSGLPPRGEAVPRGVCDGMCGPGTWRQARSA